MKKLPMNDTELCKVVFKNAGVNEPRAISDYFNLEDVVRMLEEGNFDLHKDWLWNAFAVMSDREQVQQYI